jgi:NAD(P)-dependent dehydrogenase (short-subunit alcohol dehydrogenase family)
VNVNQSEGTTRTYLQDLFGLEGKVAIVTGATGVLGGAMARGLARAGAAVGVLGRRRDRAEEVVRAIEQAGGNALALPADVLQRAELEAARDTVLRRWDRIDILVNAAGGHVPEAIVGDQDRFFDLPQDAFRQVLDLNLLGSVLPSQVFGEAMAGQLPDRPAQPPQGCIVNISSMAAQRALTRGIGYGAAKAAIDNLTRWLAVELSRKYGAGIRVNAIAPGFFLGEQNRGLLVQPDGNPTPRGRKVLDLTPAGRFGEPEELVSTLIWLCGPGATFVNGVVVPVDGGFSSFSGV